MYNTSVQDRRLTRVSPRENHREQLIAGAQKCLREKGYARATARDIAAAANSNLGSIGYHFGSKEALLNEAVRRGCAEWTEQLARVAFAETGSTPLERLRSSWVALADTFQETRPLLVALMEALAQAERSDELRRQLAELYEESRLAIGHMVAAALAGEEVDPEHIRACASFLIAVSEGLMLQWLVSPDQAPTGEEVIAGLEAALPRALARTSRP
jgi:AcrR family transcriptional regulator